MNSVRVSAGFKYALHVPALPLGTVVSNVVFPVPASPVSTVTFRRAQPMLTCSTPLDAAA
jgi:hypothetical protein